MQLIQEMISVGLSCCAFPRHTAVLTSDFNMTQDLLGQISRIREKATESEVVVRNITKEIQVLDLAKKNLILCMTTFKRLQMLGGNLSVRHSNYLTPFQ